VTFSPIAWSDGGVRILDQTLLPSEEVYLDISTIEDMVEAIRVLRVRGAPLIGIAAAMGLAAAAEREQHAGNVSPSWIREAADRLEASRPTAINLKWALDRMRRISEVAADSGSDAGCSTAALRTEAQRTWDIEAGMCRSIGDHGSQLIEPGFTVLTHCNAGRLATGGLGTALAPIYVAALEEDKGIDVIAGETRPLRQGARLTAWELSKAGVPVRVIPDGAAGSLMAAGEIDIVITGADRIAANGDTANKIGTYSLAVLANAHGIPFYVAAPRSTIDPNVATGDLIPIEHRGPQELEVAPGAGVVNPAFDVTPTELITAIVTDGGVLKPPLGEAIERLMEVTTRTTETT
jgi:methylthioribose-1-phosphate isomerase